jgi:hypothetical protein
MTSQTVKPSPSAPSRLIHASTDNKLVFDLEEALYEIRALREQKALALDALRYVAGNIGGKVGERAASVLCAINEAAISFEDRK